MCESNNSNILHSFVDIPILYSTTSNKFTKTVSSVSVALSTATKSVFSTESQIHCNTSSFSEKYNNSGVITIPPPPGFKPPVLNHYQRTNEIKTTDSYSAQSGTMVRPVSDLYLSVSPLGSKYEPEFLESSRSIYVGTDIQSTSSEKAQSLLTKSVYTSSTTNNRSFSTSCETSLPTCISPVKYTLSNISAIATKTNYSFLSQIDDPRTSRNIAKIVTSNTQTDKNCAVISNIDQNDRYENSSILSNKDANTFSNRNPFLSIKSSSRLISSSTSVAPISLLQNIPNYNTYFDKKSTQTQHIPSEKIKIVSFANKDSFLQKTRPWLAPKQENMSLPNLTSKGMHYHTESSSDEEEYNMSASYTSLNPFLPNSVLSREPLLSKINPREKFFDGDTDEVTSKTSYVEKYSCHNPFYPYATSRNKSNIDENTCKSLGENLFAFLMTPKRPKTIKDNTNVTKGTYKLSLPVTNPNICSKNDINSVCTDSFLYNTTKTLNLFTPMNYSTEPSTCANKSHHNTDISQMSISTSNSNETDVDSSKSSFPNPEEKKSGIDQTRTRDRKNSADRYAALKDLDDMFKTTVMSEGKFLL